MQQIEKDFTVKMNNDDSFNDSDEIFNLYSSKNITETFKAKLKKIVSSNPSTKNEFKNVTKVGDIYNCNVSQTAELFAVNKKSEVDCEVYSPKPVKNDSDLDNSIVIIEDEEPKNKPRQSARLRKRREMSLTDSNDSVNIELWDDKINKPLTRNRKKSAKKNKRKRNQNQAVIEEVTLDDSSQISDNNEEDEINPEVSVKVIWKSVTVKKFQIRKFQKMSKIFEELSKEEDIPEDKIMLTFNNVKINRNDTPDSLNLQVFHFIDGGVLSELTNICENSNSKVSNQDSDCVKLKFQDKNKKIVNLVVNRSDKMKVVMVKYSEQLEVPLEKIKFFLDGELLDSLETPESLGLENDEIIDIKISD